MPDLRQEAVTSIHTVMLFFLEIMAQQSCKGRGFPSTEQFSISDDDVRKQTVTHFEPNASFSVGYQVIVPDMRFDCHGHISRWSALTPLNSNDLAIDNLIHDITFQLWRPSPSDNRVYTFVGSQSLDFLGASLRAGLTVVNGTQFFRFTSAESEDERLYFQPGDVVGWYIHTFVQSVERPLTIVYRDLSSSSEATDPSLQPVDMYTAVVADTSEADTPPPCELSLCSGQFTRISSVIPYVTVDYGELIIIYHVLGHCILLIGTLLNYTMHMHDGILSRQYAFD